MPGQRPVIDFDFRSLAYTRNWIEDAHYRLEHAPVAWTEAHGGFWVLSRWGDIREAVEDWETFSSDHFNPERPHLKGIQIPEGQTRFSLTESDPPKHGPLRMTEAPFFAPKAMRGWEAIVAERVDRVIDTVIEQGECNFVQAIATPIPAMTTMELVGVPLDHWRLFALSAHERQWRALDDPLYPWKEMELVQGKLKGYLADRRADPTGDIVSAIANRVINGVPLADEDALGMLNAIIFGGFDTAVMLATHALIHLEGKQHLYPQLLEDDALIRNGVEEILRVWPSNHGIARTLTRDIEFRGQQMKAGERVFLSWAAANRDPRHFEAPDEVVLDRKNALDHMSFSHAHHKCLGAPLARLELRMLLRGIMRRMPDYRIDHDRITRFPSFATVAGFIEVPIRFTPGPKSSYSENAA